MLIALYIILGIILSFVAVLSIRAHVHVQYEDELTAYASWAFLKIPLFPRPEKPPKEKKPEKKPAGEPAEETPKEPKAKGPNPLKVLYENEQLDGIMEILGKLLEIIDKFGRRMINSFVIDEMFLDITVSRNDAAQTAEEYGKTCRKVFPLTGAVVANCNVKKYSINIAPDFIGKGHNEYAFSMEISVNPRKLINAVLLLAFGAVFKVGIRLLKGIKPKTPATAADSNVATSASEENGSSEMNISETENTITNDINESGVK